MGQEPTYNTPFHNRFRYTCPKCRVWFMDKPDDCPRCHGPILSKFAVSPRLGRKRGPKAVLIHGTRNAYKKHMCRCDLCRAATAKYNREWKKKKLAKASVV